MGFSLPRSARLVARTYQLSTNSDPRVSLWPAFSASPGGFEPPTFGLGTRLAEGKTDCLVLDFTGNAGRHKLVTPLDVLAGKPLSDDARREAQAMMDGGTPSLEALREAEERARERAERAERLRRQRVRVRVSFSWIPVDPFDDGPRVVESTRDQLLKLGMKPKDIDQLDPGEDEGRRMARYLRGRRRRGLASYRQVNLLIGKGLPSEWACALGFHEASRIVGAIADNRWQVPRWIRDEAEAWEAAG